MKQLTSDVIIVGSGVSGLYCALNLSKDLKIIILSKDSLENSDSYLAQGGICTLREESDYDSFFEDTMRAGHYENDPTNVEIMIRSSKEVISNLQNYGVRFEKKKGKLVYTREGAHSAPRILYHKDITGQEITSRLLAVVKKRQNVTLLPYTTMTDLICLGNKCNGIKALDNRTSQELEITATNTVLATGGIGGNYEHSTNFRHLTGDAIRLGHQHNIALKNLDYVQIHPTTLYSKEPGRRFLISESVRGEGAILLNSQGQRFVDELLPRDVLTNHIKEQMEKDQTPYVMLDLRPIGEAELRNHFPNILKHCLSQGYDITKEPIPVVPAQHYFMGGIEVDSQSQTSMNHLYAVGETACNGVHGANRLASNSLLESLVFAGRAAACINLEVQYQPSAFPINSKPYEIRG